MSWLAIRMDPLESALINPFLSLGPSPGYVESPLSCRPGRWIATSDPILDAIDRAERHRGKDVSGVPIWAITEHLSIGRRSAAARHVRSRFAPWKRWVG